MKTLKRTTIPLTIRLLLTEAGIDYFVRNKKPFSRFILADDAEEQGVTLSGVPAPTLQKIVLRGYVHKIEVGVHNLAEQRQSLMDLHKLVTFASLYQQFSVLTSESLIQTAAVRQWNRRYPRYAVGPGTDPADKVRSVQIAGRLLESLDTFANFLILLLLELLASSLRDGPSGCPDSPEDAPTHVIFYEQSIRADGDPDLGLHYLSFVGNICRRVGILFDPYVQPIASSGGTLINLAFTF